MAVASRAIGVLAALALVTAQAGAAQAEPVLATSAVLRAGNTAATAGDWERVAQLVDPLVDPRLDPQHQQPLASADRAEAHRLAGLAAFFRQRNGEAENHFLAYLRLDLDGRLDPALYPPDVVAFFNDVTSRHAAELRALRARPNRSWFLTLLPPFGQIQNGERTKALVLGSALGVLLVTNLTTYYYLRAWCDHTDGSGGGGLTCSDPNDRTAAAARLRPYNIASGIGFLLVYAYGVYDGVQGYRQRSRERVVRPFVDVSPEGRVVGVSGSF
jgi:hypothetical protein